MNKIFVFALLFAVASAKSPYCPPNEIDGKCECQLEFNYVVVECSDIDDPSVLLSEVQRFKGYNIDHMTLKALTLPYLPSGLFESLSVAKLTIEHSELTNVSSSLAVNPFAGLEYSLRTFQVLHTKDMNEWGWPDMTNFRQLRRVKFEDTKMIFFSGLDSWGSGSLEIIDVVNNDVVAFQVDAFVNMKNIRDTNFPNCQLVYLPRSMYARPAAKLERMDFRNNKVISLDNDLFEDMPALVFIDLSNNDLFRIEPGIYKPVYERLDYFFIKGNRNFRCDCDFQAVWKLIENGRQPSYNDFSKIECYLRKDEWILVKDLNLECKEKNIA